VTERLTEVAARLEALVAGTDLIARVAADPLRFPSRYDEPQDQEIAAILAASLAYGRVDLFGPVLERIFAVLDARGGPRRYVETFEEGRQDELATVYRFLKPPDVALLVSAMGDVIGQHGELGVLFRCEPGEADVSGGLERGVAALRGAVVAAAPRYGLDWEDFGDASYGLQHSLPAPSGGSPCKRWNLALRWLVRRSPPDLGAWTGIRPDQLVIPLDVHVHRVARFIGLTARNDASWRTAAEVTAALRILDPQDPVRFDFALAHLGISGDCLGHRDPVVCPSCPLTTICTASDKPGTSARRSRSQTRPRT
jgi:uncharacterized protein (TIGR02757 family)